MDQVFGSKNGAWTEEEKTKHINVHVEQVKSADSIRSIMPVVRIANVFGLLPLSVSNRGEFRFAWFSFITIYAIVVLVMLVGFVLVRLFSIFVNQDAIDDWVRELTSTVFYTLGGSGAFLLFYLARKLPKVLQRWSAWECSIGYTGSTRCIVIFITLIVLTSATGETTASMFYSLPNNSTQDFWIFLSGYIKAGHMYEIRLLGYNDAIGIAILLINKYATFIWNFNDVLVTCIAIMLFTHIKALNAKIEQGSSEWTGPEWSLIREDHLGLIKLMSSVNEVLGPIVLQSYVTNIFFIIVQLYLGIRPSGAETIIARLYLTWSFLHLLGRLLLVSFTCSAVFDSAKKGIVNLLSVPAENYNIEVWRLQQQILDQELGLSGYGFFLVNKSFILATTGALVTYEVILLQLNFGEDDVPTTTETPG